MRISLLSVVAVAFVFGTVQAEDVKVDPKLPEYKAVSGVSGNLSSIGSDTLNNLMTLWAEGFRKYYPNVKVQIQGKGSGTAPPALIEGTAQFGPMSRAMKSSEIDKFEEKFGFRPLQVGVAIDCLAVYVNKDNPIEGMSLQQVDAIFSKTRNGGHPADIARWGQIGLTGDWTQRPISIYGRNSVSGTYGYFKKVSLFKGDYKDTVKEQPGSASVVQSVTEDRFAIGYSGIGYKTSGVRALPLSGKTGGKYYVADYKNALTKKYPLARTLYVYTVKHPSKALPPLQLEFMRYVLSKEGQEVVVKDGYLPLTASIAKKMMRRLQGLEVSKN